MPELEEVAINPWQDESLHSLEPEQAAAEGLAPIGSWRALGGEQAAD